MGFVVFIFMYMIFYIFAFIEINKEKIKVTSKIQLIIATLFIPEIIYLDIIVNDIDDPFDDQ